MALTDAQRKQNQRDRDAGLPETYKREVKPSREEIEVRITQHQRDMEWALAQDATGNFYKSECRSCVDLLAIYEGADITDKESVEEEDPAEKKKAAKKKKKNIPNPSKSKITIKAVVYEQEMEIGNGVKVKVTKPIEPDCIDDCDHVNCGHDHRRDKEVDYVVSFQHWLDLRAKARKDLFWLGRLLGYGLYHMSHQYVCEQFVQKDFEGKYFPGYTLDDFHKAMRQQKRLANMGTPPTGVELCDMQTREMLLLEPRSSYKSTINRIDTVQWLINCPDIRIMFITAFKDLAKEFAVSIKKEHFWLPLSAEPSAFQMLFPEYILRGIDGTSEQDMECPARNHPQPQASVWATSMESSSTGKHCDICKFDDAVDPKNSADEEMREKLRFKIDGYDDVRDPWGFTDFCGTRYFTMDYYGTRQLPQEEDSKDVAPIRYSCRGSWILNQEDQFAYDRGELTCRDIIKQRRAKLVHPYKLTWAELDKILKKKKLRGFKNQQLNEATDEATEDVYINQFNLDVLRAHTYARTAAPDFTEMRVIQTWDIAYGERKTSDFSVGVTAGIYLTKQKQEAIVILDVVLDKWKSSELPMQMAAFYEKHKHLGIQKVYIEEALGVRFLINNISNFCKIRGLDYSSKIMVVPMSTKANAKRNRIKNLEFLLGQERLWFVSGSWNDEIFKQFTEYRGGKSTAYRKDDGPDAIAIVTERMSPTALTSNPDPKVVEQEHEKRQQKEAMMAVYNRMHGGPSPTAQKPTVQAPEPPPTDPRRDQLRRLIGKILPPGMRI